MTVLALFGAVEPQNANHPLAGNDRHGENRGNPFGNGLGRVFEARIVGRISDQDRFSCQRLADTLIGVRLPFGQEFLAQPAGGDQFKLMSGFVAQSQGTGFNLHDADHLVDDQLNHLLGIESGEDRLGDLMQGPEIVETLGWINRQERKGCELLLAYFGCG